MSEGLGRLFRSCWYLGAFLITGSLLANAQNPGPDADRGVQGSFRLAMQVDTVRPGPRDFLEPNAPNPFGLFSSTTLIGFSISQPSRVELRVYDFFYNEVVTLVDTDLLPGRHEIRFDPPPTMPSGMYFYELKTSQFRDLRRMVYIK